MREWKSIFKKHEFDYIIVDESHHTHAATYLPTLQYFLPKFLLGITATPNRTDLKDIRDVYGYELFELLLEDALARDLLTPVDYRVVMDGLVNLEVLNTPIGKLTIKDLNRKLFIPKRDEEITQLIQQHLEGIPNPRVMIFCRTTVHCDRLAQKIPGSVPIHYGLDQKEQRLRLESFRSGLTRTVLTVDKFNEGIDIPEANIIVFLRSTASPTVFFQQLGRGLRKSKGKKKVLVLDFVANCDRLETIHEIWQRVQAKRPGHDERHPVEVEVNRIHFTEVSRKVIDVVVRIRTGYTQELLLQKLRELAEELGRSLVTEDIRVASKHGKCGNPNTIVRYFGSIPAALEAAGLTSGSRLQPPEKILADLKKLAETLGRTPTANDVRQACREGKCAHPRTIAENFGSFPDGLRAAGLLVTHRSKLRKNYTRDVMIKQLQQLAKKLRRTPSRRDIDAASKTGKCVSPFALQNHFGSLGEAYEAAQLPLRKGKERILVQLRHLAAKLGRPLIVDDIEKNSRTRSSVSLGTIHKHFGSFHKALEAAGLPIFSRSIISKESIVLQIQTLARDLGKPPSFDDFVAASKEGKCACTTTIRLSFGSIPAARIAAGL
jgi:hypothetical protein